jgi:CRP/FNR family transcriptional regulator/CRP/FNR family cyclic AMP-dependent transcriptional regulator
MVKSVAPETALRDAMAATPFLASVAKARVGEFAVSGTVHRYRKGTYLCHQGDDAPDVFFLVEGRVEMSSVNPHGSRVLHATLDAPQFFGELGVLGGTDRSTDAVTLTDSSVWSIDADDFVGFVTREPGAARAVIRALAEQVTANQAFVDDLLFLDLKGRVAKRLLQLVTPSLDQLPEDGAVVPAITHADLASLCGGSRENVTRILTDLQRRGIVKRDEHRYVLKKVASLAKIAGL